MYNDFFPGTGDQFDRWSTGGGSAQATAADGSVITVGTDVYTGARLPNEPGQTTSPTTSDGIYFEQEPYQMALNNGQTNSKTTGPTGFNAVSTGKQNMYSQNSIHDLRKEARFLSLAIGL
ncbi:hypothetical protein HB364_27665 [Pseudoflavitalea sp. X16]|uniref:hypothetical protein n=1 Tax=Paraflavitalea devenefica TaxID=2716334 RepID=UPI00141FC418|nr:hypothetical protein [Paraflavitalea devenefica]NII28887.1 hypothetical protein [Paraflavitalea devenefica]